MISLVREGPGPGVPPLFSARHLCVSGHRATCISDSQASPSAPHRHSVSLDLIPTCPPIRLCKAGACISVHPHHSLLLWVWSPPPIADLVQGGPVASQDQMAGRGQAKPRTPVSCFLGAKRMGITARGGNRGGSENRLQWRLQIQSPQGCGAGSWSSKSLRCDTRSQGP